jgi:hypothetical protein
MNQWPRTILPQDSAENYQCPQCKKVKCEHGGKYAEVTAEYFARESGLMVRADSGLADLVSGDAPTTK